MLRTQTVHLGGGFRLWVVVLVGRGAETTVIFSTLEISSVVSLSAVLPPLKCPWLAGCGRTGCAVLVAEAHTSCNFLLTRTFMVWARISRHA